MFAKLKVLELASVLAGPAAGQFFAELGAQVLKIENPATQGDVTRQWKLPSEDAETDISGYFSAFNWGKESLALNLQTPQGQKVIHELAKQADIVIVNYKPGDAEKLKVDYQTLHVLNPALIYAHLTGYGLNAPRSGFDAIVQAESGLMFLNGPPDGPPTKMPVALVDILAAHQLKEALLVALLLRQNQSQGRYIHVSLYEAAVASLANQATNWLVGHQEPQRLGSEHPNIAPYGSVYQTKEAQSIVLAIGTEAQFKSLCRLLGHEEWLSDPRFKDNVLRVQHRHILDHCLQDAISTWSCDSLLKVLWQENIPVGCIQTVSQALASPLVSSLLHQHDTLWGVRSNAFAISGVETISLTPPPHYGEHTFSALKSWLHLDDIQLAGLCEQQVIEDYHQKSKHLKQLC